MGHGFYVQYRRLADFSNHLKALVRTLMPFDFGPG
jgi:hypothetical protein